MADVKFYDDLPVGSRLEDFFVAPVSGIAYSSNAAWESASFDIQVGSEWVHVLYQGPMVGPDEGNVSIVQYELAGRLLFTYRSGSVQSPGFGYENGLAAFQSGGYTTAAVVMAGNDRLLGSANADFLEGFDGNDILDGRDGADILVGGTGDDSYRIDDPADRVVEAEHGGFDSVLATVSYKLEDGDEIEQLEAAAGTKAIALTGNGFANVILGNAGPNILNGRGGRDTLRGLAGDDTYIVEGMGVQITEAARGGFDTVQSRVSFVLRDGDAIEALTASGTGGIALTGNSSANVLTGNLGKNALHGMGGSDDLFGDGGNDSLWGGLGADRLFGGIGSDRLVGDDGNDVLYGDVGNDALLGGAGNDVLYAGVGDDGLKGGSGSDSLYGDVGRDTLHGESGDDRVFGGAGDNALWGEEGNDTIHGGPDDDIIQGGSGSDALNGFTGDDRIYGGAGKDTLATGEGYDVIVFDTTPRGRSDMDTISDFNRWTDHIALARAEFDKLPGRGALPASAFCLGAIATEPSHRVIFDALTGVLSYDPDGSGPAAKIALAELGKMTLSQTAFLIV